MRLFLFRAVLFLSRHLMQNAFLVIDKDNTDIFSPSLALSLNLNSKFKMFYDNLQCGMKKAPTLVDAEKIKFLYLLSV